MVSPGDLVQDIITGFEGIAVSIHTYLMGCRRVTVQPKTKDGHFQESQTFDEPQLVIIEKGHVKKPVIVSEDDDPGGPDKYMPAKRSTGER